MSVIVTCGCNAKLKIPEEWVGKRVRCPRCQAEVDTTTAGGGTGAAPAIDTGANGTAAAASGRADAVAPGAGAAAGRLCPICQTAIGAGEVALACPECRQVHHRECWAEVGGCSTYGCPRAPELAKPEAPAEPPRAAWGDTKTCPVCAETIKSIALRCRFCGTDFHTVDPLTIRDLGKRAGRQETFQRVRTNVWVLFVLSLIGCTAPIMLIVNLGYVLPKRATIAKAGPLYTVVAYVAIALTVLYNLMILLFVVLSHE